MSYILQALAQSERDRRDTDATDLAHIFDTETPATTGSRRRTLFFTIVLVNVAVITALILFGDFQFGGKASTSSETVTNVAAASAPIIESNPASRQEAAFTKAPSQPIVTAPSASGMPTDNAPINDVATPIKPAENLPIVDTVKTAMRDIPVEEAAINEIPITEPQAIVKKPAVAATQQAAKKPEYSNIETVKKLAGIDMSVHAYSDKLSERFVFINGNEYHEGDTLNAQGARLEAITQDGIVVDLGNRRVLLSRLR